MCFLELITTMWGERLLCEIFSIDPKIYRELLQRAKKEDTLSSIVDQMFVLLSIFFWSLCCLCFFDLRICITPLVSSNSSNSLWSWKMWSLTILKVSPTQCIEDKLIGLCHNHFFFQV